MWPRRSQFLMVARMWLMRLNVHPYPGHAAAKVAVHPPYRGHAIFVLAVEPPYPGHAASALSLQALHPSHAASGLAVQPPYHGHAASVLLYSHRSMVMPPLYCLYSHILIMTILYRLYSHRILVMPPLGWLYSSGSLISEPIKPSLLQLYTN